MKSGSMPYHLCLDVLGNPLRIAMIKELERGPKSVGELAENTGEEQSKVSHNLKKLVECHFVEATRKGKERVYSLNKKTIIPLLNLVEKHTKSYCGRICLKKK